jgi:DUF971 family protein
MAPSEVHLTRDRRKLEIVWHGGARSYLDASHLRANCRAIG